MYRVYFLIYFLGVNRAYPFAKASMESLNEHKETLYKIIHVTTNFTVTLHALMLLYQVQGDSDTEDRFYSAYYKKMLDSELSNMNRHAQFLNLTFKVSFIIHYGILLPKLFWPTVRKNCTSDREKLLKFEAEGQEFAKFLRSLEQFIQTVKDQNFW